jgi:hypothetical protein
VSLRKVGREIAGKPETLRRLFQPSEHDQGGSQVGEDPRFLTAGDPAIFPLARALAANSR